MVIDGWQLQQIWETQGKLQTWLCNPMGHPQSFQAQILVDTDANSPERIYFERKAAIATMLPVGVTPALLHSNLDAANPLQIYPLEPRLTLDSWLDQQSHWPSSSTMLRLASQLIYGLGALHALGYGLAHLRPDTFLVEVTPEPRILLGDLGHCDFARGHSTRNCSGAQHSGDAARGYSTEESKTTGGTAPVEMTRGAAWGLSTGGVGNSGESHYGESARGHSTCGSGIWGDSRNDLRAENVAEAANVLAVLLGVGFLNSQLAHAMMHEEAEARPTASQILPLLLDLETELTGIRREVA